MENKILNESRNPVFIPKVYIPKWFMTSMYYLMDNWIKSFKCTNMDVKKFHKTVVKGFLSRIVVYWSRTRCFDVSLKYFKKFPN